MRLEKSLSEIKKFLKDRYKDNLAAILIFGSANTGPFIEGVSDIDAMVFLKRQKSFNIKDEPDFLYNSLKNYNFATQYFHTLEGIKEYLEKRNSWSTYITIVSDESSRVLYSSPEFEETRNWLKKHPPSKKGLKEYIKRKDNVELRGYFRDAKDFILTKALLSHLRRKLQIINYYETERIIFDYEKCLEGVSLEEDKKRKLKKLYSIYKKRKSLSEKEIKGYYKLASEFTNKIVKRVK